MLHNRTKLYTARQVFLALSVRFININSKNQIKKIFEISLEIFIIILLSFELQ